jgi:PAS domain S-box-containing protein
MPDTILSLQQEIAALKKENEAFRESQLRFTTIFENSRLGNKIIGSDLKILQLNAAMVALLGYDHKEEIIGTKIIQYAPPDHHQDWSFLQEKLWEKSTPSFSLETRLIKKDGTVIWCQVTSILFPDNGVTLGYTIIEDVTEKYNLRQQKEQFISVASHELKTPITSLKATLQVVHRMVSGDFQMSDKFRQLITSAMRSTDKLTHLVGDLLNTTKIEHGELALNKHWFAISEVMETCCSHIQLEGKYRIIFHGDHELKVFADHHKIDQVVVNFINNAMKYAPKSLEIIVSVEKLANSVKISVTDYGEGIPAEDVAQVFNRYYRVDTAKNQASGLGLGLFISSEIVRRHGGEIGVDSVVGTGTTFWFTLPDPEETVSP